MRKAPPDPAVIAVGGTVMYQAGPPGPLDRVASGMRTPVGIRRHSSPAVARLLPAIFSLSDASVRRRVAWIWALLFLNVVPYSTKSRLVPLPTRFGELITYGALIVALLLAVSINRRILVRPNFFLLLMTVLCILSFMMSVRGYFGLGSTVRALRLIAIVGVLWILTPWWGRTDLLLLRYLRRTLFVVLMTVLLGAAMFPHTAYLAHRLSGTIWPVNPTQVSEFAAILGGTTIILWFEGLVGSRGAAIATAFAVAFIIFGHSRVALIGMLCGILIAGLSLFLTHRRVRKTIAVAAVAGALIALSFAPALGSWLRRGETSRELTSLSGRETVWSALVSAPRTEINTLFGYGLSNNSYSGLPIDSSWYSTYLNQGLVGDVIDAATLLTVLLVALFRSRDIGRPIALFLVVYCFFAAFTEDGLGQATPYLLYLVVAMSVIMAPAARVRTDASPLMLPPV